MSAFRAGTGTGEAARAVEAAVASLGALPPGTSLGFVYATDRLADALPAIGRALERASGIAAWVGTVGAGIVGPAGETFDEPAITVLTAALPAGNFRLHDRLGPQAFAPDAAAPGFAIAHADPEGEGLAEAVAAFDPGRGFVVGGIAASRTVAPRLAGRPAKGALSGVVFDPAVRVATGLTQGCTPIGPSHRVDAAVGHVVVELDGRPALDVLKEEIGDLLARRLERIGGLIHAALPVAGSDTGDYVVRNLIGFDAAQGAVAIAAELEPGDRVLFVRRDPQSAEADLRAMLKRTLARLPAPPQAAHYVSCLARGPHLFGGVGRESAILREFLGDVPLAGFYANGEISGGRLYAYTGVLTLFL